MGHELTIADVRRVARREAEEAVAGLRGLRTADADRFQGRHLSAKAPTDNYYLGWNDTTKKWEPKGINFVRKSAVETVNDSDTMQDDNHLLFAIAANETWIFEAFISYSSTTTADLQCTFTTPAGSTVRIGYMLPDSASDKIVSRVSEASGTVRTAGGLDATIICIYVKGTVVNGTTAGNVQFRWAQSTAEASDTNVHANSWIKAHQL